MLHKISVQFYSGDKQIALAAMSGVYTPISYARMQIVGWSHCCLTCKDWLRNSGGGGDSVGEVAIFRSLVANCTISCFQ